MPIGWGMFGWCRRDTSGPDGNRPFHFSGNRALRRSKGKAQRAARRKARH